jgi:hypothetical protein
VSAVRDERFGRAAEMDVEVRSRSVSDPANLVLVKMDEKIFCMGIAFRIRFCMGRVKRLDGIAHQRVLTRMRVTTSDNDENMASGKEGNPVLSR